MFFVTSKYYLHKIYYGLTIVYFIGGVDLYNKRRCKNQYFNNPCECRECEHYYDKCIELYEYDYPEDYRCHYEDYCQPCGRRERTPYHNRFRY